MGLIELSLWDKLKRIKADKVVGAVEGNFAKLDANGNLVDSGHKDADYEDADATILKEADVVDSLDSTSTTAPLSAKQGKLLKDEQDKIKGTGWTGENLVDHESRIGDLETNDTLQDATLGTLKETVLSTKLAVNELERQAQIGNGATLDFSDIGIVPLDARATGRANPMVKGLTATNLVVNGDFSDGTNNWNILLACTLSESNNILSITGNGVNAIVRAVSDSINASVDDEIYYKYKGRVTNSLCSSIRLYIKDGGVLTTSAIIDTPTINTWYELEVIHTALNSTMEIVIQQTYGSTTDATGAVMEVDHAVAQNLTQTFGAGNEPSATDCAKIFSYFEGTKSIQLPARVRSVGKNLFDGKLEIGSWNQVVGNTASKTMSTNIRNVNLIPVIGGKDIYVLKFRDDVRTAVTIRLNQYDRNKILIKTGVTNANLITLDNATMYVSFHGSGLIITDKIFISETHTSVYEPYTDSTLYIADNEEVRSFGATTDLVKVVNGVFVLEKNINDDATAVISPPIITPLTTSGILKAFQNGSVYYEPYYEGSHQTNASSQITLPYEGTIEAVYGYDEDLVEYLLDSSEYSLTGTTLTITGALENEVFFVQMSRSEPLAPEMSVNTLNNEQVIADTSNGKFYKLVPTITNGELVSQTPVEVV